MRIVDVEQKRDRVYAYDKYGEELFSVEGKLVRHKGDFVFVRNEGKTCKLDAYGNVVDPDVKGEGGSLIGTIFGLVVIGVLVAHCAGNSDTPTTKAHSDDTSFAKDYNKRTDIFHDAMDLFLKHNYPQAQERFEWLAQIKYRPAFNSYMAGQCAYKQHHYQEAIHFYKKSLAIKNKATYTPILLDNTARAYKALKDTKNYKHYLHILAKDYPESDQGKQALKALQRHP
ncbi:tetratricopeptide repeat protein [Helicobacter bizzozeronii]|uniref:tetratricopeptide repeat protein n=1 Tax=Helicobacter bizzozeronii TaxID=56877 RepID=UPI001F1EBFDF|nr:hypothetical protein [Helicobacter bizzozeronii]